MDLQSRYRVLFSYRWETCIKLIELAGNLSEESYRENPGYGHGSIHELLFHLLRADHVWRTAIETKTQPDRLKIEDFTNITAIMNGFINEQKKWKDLLGKMKPNEYDQNIELITAKGDNFSIVCWKVLEHIIIHGIQHCTEISQILTRKGYSPGDIDILFYKG
jgi:uncharacterized damage-inducible protein DinB